MHEAYTVYWPQERWRPAATVGQNLTVLFGGPHTSMPSFRRATVQPGDLLYPIGVNRQVLYVFGRMRVREIDHIGDDRPRLDQYFAQYVGWKFLAPTCTSEVVIGAEGTRLYFDRPVPGEVLKRLLYRPRRGPRPVRHVNEDGRLMNTFSVQGIYRLSEASEADLEAVLTAPPGKPIARLPPLAFSQGMDPLF